MQWAIWQHPMTEPIGVYENSDQAQAAQRDLIAGGTDPDTLVVRRYVEHHVGQPYSGTIEITKQPG